MPRQILCRARKLRDDLTHRAALHSFQETAAYVCRQHKHRITPHRTHRSLGKRLAHTVAATDPTDLALRIPNRITDHAAYHLGIVLGRLSRGRYRRTLKSRRSGYLGHKLRVAKQLLEPMYAQPLDALRTHSPCRPRHRRKAKFRSHLRNLRHKFTHLIGYALGPRKRISRSAEYRSIQQRLLILRKILTALKLIQYVCRGKRVKSTNHAKRVSDNILHTMRKSHSIVLCILPYPHRSAPWSSRLPMLLATLITLLGITQSAQPYIGQIKTLR